MRSKGTPLFPFYFWLCTLYSGSARAVHRLRLPDPGINLDNCDTEKTLVLKTGFHIAENQTQEA
jgi:hypothetical protein